MQNFENFFKVLEQSKSNIRTILGEYEETTRHKKIFKIFETLMSFEISLVSEKNSVQIYYFNKIFDFMGDFSIRDHQLILTFMTFYTNIAYYTLSAKPYVDEQTYEKLCIEKENLGKAIKQICMRNFEQIIITADKIQQIKKFLSWATPQLHHISGPIGEYSEKFVSEDSEALREIREIYEDFRIARKYIYFYDEFSQSREKVLIYSPQAGYAVCSLFSSAYAASILWLKEYDPSGQWCPIVPWNIIQKFRILITNIFME